ncbi:transposase [Amaricoccus sp.]|uniref:transposase n=1 Tax=Amaricoccus sp. TaxID=1872485 RepID=UPI00260E16CD|nr:transposase [Amaricoccus sp.]HRO13098.1 transposase [Amaricoccus sp.]
MKALLALTQAALADSEEARHRLEAILTDLRREKFGAKSEKLSPDQFSLALEDVELAQGVLDAPRAVDIRTATPWAHNLQATGRPLSSGR